jgi:dTDP-4-dehydrorhamnose reductase
MAIVPEPVLVTGSRGMLGSELVRILRAAEVATVALGREDLDICSEDSVRDAIARHGPAVIINAAAVTDVDGCESEPERAFAVNGEGPGRLAREAAAAGAFLVHVSTDYVFDGTQSVPYAEDHPTNPINVYGRSKELGEKLVEEALPERSCIVRTQWLFGLHGKNFVESILHAGGTRPLLRVVSDQHGCPTAASDLAAAILLLLRVGARGLVHVTNHGETTWHGFAREIIRMSGMEGVRVEPITTEELQRPAPRPRNSVLDVSRFVRLTGTALRPWQEALEEYLAERKGFVGGLARSPIRG